MRAGLLIYGSLETLSGGYLYDRKMVEALRAAGDEVQVVSLPWRSYPLHLTDNFRQSLLNRLLDLQIDVLVQDELNHPSLFLLNERLRARAPYRIIGLVHHLRISEAHPRLWMPVYRAVERRYLRSVDGFILNSRTTQGIVEGMVGRVRPAVVAYPAGDRLPVAIDAGAIATRAMESGPLRILFLGNVIPRKGLHVLLAALGRLPAAEWTLDVVGGFQADAPYARRMQAAVQRRGWGTRVTFHGPIADGNLLPILLRSHVLAMPSQYEGFGIAYLEGMGAGLPAIATTAGAAGEIVADGETGYLIPPGDAGRLAEALAGLHADRASLARQGSAARQRYAAHPGWEESMRQVRVFLAGIVGSAEIL